MGTYDDHPGKGRVPITGWVPPAGSRAEYLLRMEREAARTPPYSPPILRPFPVYSPGRSSLPQAELKPIPMMLPPCPPSPTCRATRSRPKSTSEPSVPSLLIGLGCACWCFVAVVSGILKAAFRVPEEQAAVWAITAFMVLVGLAISAAVLLALWALIRAAVEWVADHREGLILAAKLAFHAGLFGFLVTRLVAAHSAVVTWLGIAPSASTPEVAVFFSLATGLLQAALWFGGRAVFDRRAWLLRGLILLVAKPLTRSTKQEFVRIEPAFSGKAPAFRRRDVPRDAVPSR